MKHASLTTTLMVLASVLLATIAVITISVSRQAPISVEAVAIEISTVSTATVKAKPDAERPDSHRSLPKTPSFYPFRVSACSWSTLKSKFGEEGALTILKLNRIDRANLRKGDTLMVSDDLADDGAVSPFPTELETARDIPKLILVSRSVQAFGAYESGRLVRWGPTSTGKKSTQTPDGLYHTNWKSKKSRSTVDSNWILPWVFNLDNFEGIAFHQYELPGYPASHGCVRLLREDAQWIYGWADMWMLSAKDRSLLAYGTPVVIFGAYNWRGAAPWKRLNVDPNAASVTTTEAGEVLMKYMPLIHARTRARGTLLSEISRLSFATL